MLSVFLRNFQARKSFCRMLVLLLLRIGFGAWPPLSASEGDTLALPYVWNFSSLESFENEWTVLDANGDAQTWAWADWVQGSDGRMGGVFSSVFAGRNDDWLISKPLVFGEGLHYLSCYLKISYPPTGEVPRNTMFRLPTEGVCRWRESVWVCVTRIRCWLLCRESLWR